MRHVIYTIGSSTRTWEEFHTILVAHGIRALADVRAFPVSRRYPHFTREQMASTLPQAGINYHWLGKSLGGHRAGGYEAYIKTDAYLNGVAELEGIARQSPTAFLCAERLPSKCHRRFIAGTLQERGWKVVHILDVKRVLTPSEPEPSFPGSPSPETLT